MSVFFFLWKCSATQAAKQAADAKVCSLVLVASSTYSICVCHFPRLTLICHVHVCMCVHVCVCQADEETIVAALLHDIGWLVPKPQDASLLTSSDESVND